MQPQLVRHGGVTPPGKEWSFSYSKLKNYRTCPKRHYHTDMAPKGSPDKVVEDTEQLDYGNKIHKLLEDAIGKNIPLPADFAGWLQPYVDMGKRVPNVRVEQQLTITKDFQKTGWFAPNAWYRAKIDVLGIVGPVAVALDWKTGKIVEDSEQLILAAACIMICYPEVQAVRTEFVWLKEGCSTRLDVRRGDVAVMWSQLLPELAALKHAQETHNYPPVPGRLCRRYCPVTQCPHHGTLPEG